MATSDYLDWKDIIGTSATIWTILQMLSPVPTCYNFIKKKSVGDMIVTPYIVALTSCTLWLLYGKIIDDSTVVNVNLVGMCLQFSYTLCYYIFSCDKAIVRQQFALAACIIISTAIYSVYEINPQKLISFFGFLCCSVTVLFFISPLGNMHYIIKIWNSESLPRLLIASTFIVSIQWLLYGYMVNDNYIKITNLLGTLLSGCQLILAVIIPRDPTRKGFINV